MNGYIVELHGEVREVYFVEATSEQEARETWQDGELQVSEAEGMEVYSVREESA